MKKLQVNKGRHCVFLMHAHLVFTPKYRHKVFKLAHLKSLKLIFSKICADAGAVLAEFNGESDHVHLLISFAPQIQLSKLVNSLKGASSYRMKRLHPDLLKYYWKNALWSPSYFAATCGGASLDVLKQYIADQKTPIK